jgi:chromosome segregation ATPase
MTNDLKAHLLANPHLQIIYVNDKGEYLFHKRAGFEKSYSRDEILEMEIASETPTVDNIAKQTGPAIIPDAQNGKGGSEKLDELRDAVRKEVLEEIRLNLDQFEADKAEHAKAVEDFEIEREILNTEVNNLKSEREQLEADKLEYDSKVTELENDRKKFEADKAEHAKKETNKGNK